MSTDVTARAREVAVSMFKCAKAMARSAMAPRIRKNTRRWRLAQARTHLTVALTYRDDPAETVADALKR
jgi:hypothetical protein